MTIDWLDKSPAWVYIRSQLAMLMQFLYLTYRAIIAVKKMWSEKAMDNATKDVLEGTLSVSTI